VTREAAGPESLDPRPADLRLELTRDANAPAVARAAVRSLCDDLEIGSSQPQTLALLVSELVSNAVVHSGAPIDRPVHVCVGVSESTVRVAVTDAGQGFGEGFAPAIREPTQPRGRLGLYLLDRAARRWGVDHTHGTRVWFELAR
jgi:anti-sigma regulatory factor (Ser/Thr protein kinase)